MLSRFFHAHFPGFFCVGNTLNIVLHTPPTERGFHMLLLNLSEGDYIIIGDNIKVHFDHKVNQDTMDLAVEAPREISVLRGKLYEEAKREVS